MDDDTPQSRGRVVLARSAEVAQAAWSSLIRSLGSRMRLWMTPQPRFLAVPMSVRIAAKSFAPWSERKQPEIFCLSFIIRPSRSAWLVTSQVSRGGSGGVEFVDQVLGVSHEALDDTPAALFGSADKRSDHSEIVCAPERAETA